MASSFVADDEQLVRVAFNRDATHLVAATSSGIRVFSCSPFEHVFTRSGFFFASPDGGPAGEVTSADLGPSSSSLVAVVFGGDTIRYWNEAHGEMMSADMSPSVQGPVRAVRHVGDHVLIAEDERVTLHEISRDGGVVKVKQIMQVETGPNPQGACALAQAQEGFVLACPSPTIGEAQVWHGSNGARVAVRAHNCNVTCLELSGDGRLLAAASFTGTIVRIFSATDGLTLQELIRGTARAEIHSMVFSPDCKWLAVSSDKAAVDMFSVKVSLTSSTPADGLEAAPPPSDAMSPHTRASLVAHFTAKYPVAELWLERGVRRMAGFGQEPNTILVVGLDGSFYRCQFDPLKGHMKPIEHKKFMTME